MNIKLSLNQVLLIRKNKQVLSKTQNHVQQLLEHFFYFILRDNTKHEAKKALFIFEKLFFFSEY